MHPESSQLTDLDLGNIPPISVLSAHLKGDEEHELREKLLQYRAPITNDLSKVKVLIGRVATKKRAQFELRSRKFKVEEVVDDGLVIQNPPRHEGPPSKRRKVEGSAMKPIVVNDENSTTEDEGKSVKTADGSQPFNTPISSPVETDENVDLSQAIFGSNASDDVLFVVKVDWLEKCIAKNSLLPLADYQVLKCKVIERPPRLSTPASKTAGAAHSPSGCTRKLFSDEILSRAKSDVGSPILSVKGATVSTQASKSLRGHAFSSVPRTAHLLQKTTSEYEGTDSDIPEAPEWVKKGVKYSCQRYTPSNPPNQEFIELLKKILTTRLLTGDDIGVRAYSTIIASIAAYPYKFSHPREVMRLPGCETKVANLWIEFKNTGTLQELADFDSDEMKVLRLFYDIWGVGAKTARQFQEKGWKELDDIIEYGWDSLDRVQQIGVKFYNDFLRRIPRREVEDIAYVVCEHAIKLRDDRISVTIVGGYRKGKETCGDVDLIVSHPVLEATAGLIQDLIEALEDSGWITHILSMSLHNTNRGQSTLPFRSNRGAGAGFDTLDKALVVWQDPDWEGRGKEDKKKNTNVHRRVDIIVAPWRTVGCAVLGWSGGTTFERDLRRYAKYVKGWKFDSSGIRSRVTGEVVELEGPDGVDGTTEDAERRVFEGLGLQWIPPTQRCTG